MPLWHGWNLQNVHVDIWESGQKPELSRGGPRAQWCCGKVWKQIRSYAGILATQVEEKLPPPKTRSTSGVCFMLAGCATGSVFNMDSLLLSVPLVAFMRIKSAAMVRPFLGASYY